MSAPALRLLIGAQHRALFAAALLLSAVCCLVLLVPSRSEALPTGTRSIEVVIGKFADDAGYPYTVAEANDAVFDGKDSAQAFYNAITGVTYGGREDTRQVSSTMNRAEVTDCGSMFDFQNDIAAQAGTGGATHTIIVGPRNEVCPPSAFGEFGDSAGSFPKSIFLNGRLTHNGEPNWRLVAHEMGHGYGARHAGACRPTFPKTPCNGDDYGDPFDIMGASTGALAGWMSSWNLYRQGQIAGSRVRIANQTGSYSLTAGNQLDGKGTKLILIPRSDPDLRYYALEIRARRSLDNFLDAGARLYNAVTVRLAVDPLGPPSAIETFIVPANPAAAIRDWPLAACETYSEPAEGIKLRTLSAGGGEAEIQIAVGGDKLKGNCGGGSSAKKKVKLKAKPRKAKAGVQIRLITRMTPCRAANGERVIFQRKVKKGWEKVGKPRQAKGKRCKATGRVKLRKTSVFRARSPKSSDYGNATSNKVKVRARG